MNCINLIIVDVLGDLFYEFNEYFFDYGIEFYKLEVSVFYVMLKDGVDSILRDVIFVFDIVGKFYFLVIMDLKSGEFFVFNGN